MIRKRGWIALLAGLLAVAPAMSQQQVPVGPKTHPAAAAAVVAAEPTPGTPALTATDVGAWLDGNLPAALEQGKIAGAQVVIVKDGQILFKKGYGYADVAAKTKMDVDHTLMRIGSTSKLFTWTAVMQLVEAGKIDLNVDVNRYLDFKITPKSGRAITMTDLMTHRPGFEEGLKDLIAIDPKRFQTTERYLKEHPRPQLFPAGAAPAYSNYGAALAGYIVERVSGEPFATYVERHILQPLQMRRTTFVQPLPPALAPFLSKGYMQSNQDPGPFEFATTAPAGSVSATGTDMANFMIAHLQEGRFGASQILRPETARLMHSPSLQETPGFSQLAHGFFYGYRNGQRVIGHGGDTIVFHTDLNLLPDQGVGVFVSFNSRGQNDAVYGARDRLFAKFMDRYFPAPSAPTPQAIASAAADAARLAGHYESSRRVESGFISLFYLIQQDAVTPNPDGTISLASIEDKRFREIAPGLWREVDGQRQLKVTDVGGRVTLLDSDNPVGVLQAVPLSRNSSLNLTVAALAFLVLLATALLWPAAWWLRRSYPEKVGLAGRPALLRRLTRVAAVADIVYLIGWYMMLTPALAMRYYVYNAGMDGWTRLLQVAAIVPIAGAVIGIWNAVLTFAPSRGWGARVRSIIVAAALIGIVWVAWMGGLISFDLNY
jgi:CubicO group peptidase (beta-lactamase class C family)